jgi:hypothetical protein
LGNDLAKIVLKTIYQTSAGAECKVFPGRPANFLDIHTNCRKSDAAEGLKISRGGAQRGPRLFEVMK